MTSISKSHKCFSELLNEPRVLTNPEEFLGPNYKAVLNFWLWSERLSEDQLKDLIMNYMDLFFNKRSNWFKGANRILFTENQVPLIFAIHAGCKTIEPFLDREIYQPRYACGEKIEKFIDIENHYLGDAYRYATLELIKMHKILEQQKPLTFFPLFLTL